MSDLSPTGERRWVNAINRLWASASTGLLTASAIVLAINGGWQWWHFGGAALGVSGVLVSIFQRRVDHSSAAKSASRRAEDLRGSLRILLNALLVDLSLQRDDTRISLYAHAGDSFHMIARTSVNTELARPGRNKYPAGQGIIGQAWKTGYCRVAPLPESRDEWNTVNAEEYVLPRSVTKKLTMQSRSFIGFRLSRGPAETKAFGVLVIESLEPDVLTDDVLDRLYDDASGDLALLTTIAATILTGLNETEIEDLQTVQTRGPGQAAMPPPPTKNKQQ